MDDATKHNEVLAAVLAAEARAAGLDETDMDEHVYDCWNEGAAAAYNAGDGNQGSDEADYEHLHGAADQDASRINNTGLEGQLCFLLGALGEPSVRMLLAEENYSMKGDIS